jgi:hypothetical protein
MPNSIGAARYQPEAAGFQQLQASAPHSGARSIPRVSLGLRGTSPALTLSEGWGRLTLEHFHEMFIA